MVFPYIGPLLRLRSDERLFALACGGRDDAFGVLLARYRPRLLRFCWGMANSAHAAERAVEGVAATAHRSLSAHDPPTAVGPWLYRIAREELRRMPRRRPAADAEPAGDLMAGIARLAEPQRAALLMREVDRLPYEDIAAALGTSVDNVKAVLVQARVALAETAQGPGP